MALAAEGAAGARVVERGAWSVELVEGSRFVSPRYGMVWYGTVSIHEGWFAVECLTLVAQLR